MCDASCSETMTSPFRILSIDGGGARGVVAARLLVEIENVLRRRYGPTAHLADYVDLVAGTSTGAIVGGLLLLPDGAGGSKYDAQTVLKLYQERLPEIFTETYRSRITSAFGWTGPLYSPSKLEALLRDYAGDHTLLGLRRPCLFTAHDVSHDKAHFFTNVPKVWHAETVENFKLVDVMRATTAAPTYFPSIHVKTPQNQYEFVDGGLFANNPALCALTEARCILKQPKIEQTVLISLSCGSLRRPLHNTEHWGKLQWAWPVIDIQMQTSAQVVDTQLEQIYHSVDRRRQYVRMDPTLTKNVDLDDVSTATRTVLLRDAERWIDANRPQLETVIDLLTRKL